MERGIEAMGGRIVRRVILESPYAGDVKYNRKYARLCVRDCLMRGEAPIASHLLFTQRGILRDDVEKERKLGIAAGHAWIKACDAMVVYTDRGISSGMQLGINVAQAYGVPVEVRSIW